MRRIINFKMNQGTCLLCFSVAKVFNIKYTHLQNVYEELSGIEIQAAPHPLCYICYTKLLQSQQLLKQIQENNRASQTDARPLVQLSMVDNYAWSLPQNSAKIQFLPVTIKEENLEFEEKILKPDFIKMEPVENEEVSVKTEQEETNIVLEPEMVSVKIEPVEEPVTKAAECEDLEFEMKILKPDFIIMEPVENEEVSVKTEQEETNIIHEPEMVSVKIEPAEEPVTQAAECEDLPISNMLECVIAEGKDDRSRIAGKQSNSNSKSPVIEIELIPVIKFEPDDNTDNELGDKCDIKKKLPKSENRCEDIDGTKKRNKTYTHTCEVCNKNFTRSDHLKRHMRSHTGERPHACHVCDKKLATASSLKDHIRIHVGEKSCSCDVCGKSFYTTQDVKRHKVMHSDHKKHKCDICNKRFARSGNLKAHKQTHIGPSPYTNKNPFTYLNPDKQVGVKLHTCEICNETFTAPAFLKTHMLLHFAEKEFNCDICSKKFASSISLKKHQLVHTGEKAYACDTCGKRFACNSYLKNHKLIHTGDKPFACEICSKKYRYNWQLKMHKLSHTDHKPHACEFCGKKFIQLGDLRRHIQVHTGEKTYRCDVCSRTFIMLCRLKRHKCATQDQDAT